MDAGTGAHLGYLGFCLQAAARYSTTSVRGNKGSAFRAAALVAGNPDFVAQAAAVQGGQLQVLLWRDLHFASGTDLQAVLQARGTSGAWGWWRQSRHRLCNAA